ncbi:MAG: tetratricopeptide repeat protein [Lentisphaerae bacterium]|jgi:tetratricopeptide (TPR) repeat protein|nr:tetratricopeptide repeat protein [Lentisphaerota bacterium]
MVPFKSVPSAKRRVDNLLSVVLGLGVLILYLATLSTSLFPGNSSVLVAQSLGLEDRGLPLRPLFYWASDAWAMLPILSSAARLNLFSVLCGVVSMVLLYRLVSFFIYEMIYEEQALMQADKMSWLAGVVAVVAAAGSMAMWSSATRLHFESFDLMLLLICGMLLVGYAQTKRASLLLLSAFMYGACIPESSVFIAFVPLYILVVVFTLWKNESLSVVRVGWLGVFAVCGLMLVYWLAARSFLYSTAGQAEGYIRVYDVMVDLWRQQYKMMRTMLPPQWVWMVLFGAGAWLVAMLASSRTLNNERGWSFSFLHIVLTGLVIAALFNLPFTPWWLCKLRGGLPVISAVLAAVLVGYLVAYWFLLWRAEPARRDTSATPLEQVLAKWLGRILVWPLLVAVVMALFVNGFGANGHRGAFADAFANKVLDQLGERRWMVTDGTLDAHLTVRAAERKQPLFLIGLHKDNSKIFQAKLKKEIVRLQLFDASEMFRMNNTIDLGVLPFIQDWFATDPDINDKMAVFGVPDLWYSAGLNPVSEFLFFGGMRDLKQVKPAELLPQYLAFWDETDRLLPRIEKSESQRDTIDNYYSYLRRHIGFLGNNLGVLFEELGANEEAYQVYVRMRKFDPQNVSVLFNQFEMIRRGNHVEDKEAVEAAMNDYVANLKHRYSLWSLSRHFGYVRSPELFAQMGWNWAMSGQMGAGLAGIRRAMDLLQGTDGDALLSTMASMYALGGDTEKSAELYEELLRKDPSNRQAMLSLARLAIQGGDLDVARNWMEKARELGVAGGMSMGLEFAALHLSQGNLSDARLLLQEVTDSQPQNLQAWAMLSVVQIQQGDVIDVERVILPRMIKTSGTVDNYFVQVTRAQVAMHKGRNFFGDARDAFIRAAMLRPDVPGVRDMILQLDIGMNDQERAELHARQTLRLNRNHALANYVMGHLRLNARQYGEAADFLKRSVDADPKFAAMNDYAECLRRMRRYGEAEEIARKAIEYNSDQYVIWETLASILIEQGKFDEAEKALETSLSLDESDLRVTVSMAYLQLRKGDKARARELAGIVRKRQSELPDYDLERLQEIIAELERL